MNSEANLLASDAMVQFETQWPKPRGIRVFQFNASQTT